MDKETERQIKDLIAERAIEKRISKWVRTVCMTSTSIFLSGLVWLGGQIYDKFDAIQAGIRAFLETLRHGQ